VRITQLIPKSRSCFVRSEWPVVSLDVVKAVSATQRLARTMKHSTKVAVATAAVGVLLLAGAATLAALASESVPGAFSVGLQEWSDLIVALGLIGYAAALLVAAFGTPRPRHVRG
jgi:hypothetical protein